MVEIGRGSRVPCAVSVRSVWSAPKSRPGGGAEVTTNLYCFCAAQARVVRGIGE